MGKVFHMAGAAHENLLAPIVVDDAWVDNNIVSNEFLWKRMTFR